MHNQTDTHFYDEQTHQWLPLPAPADTPALPPPADAPAPAAPAKKPAPKTEE